MFHESKPNVKILQSKIYWVITFLNLLFHEYCNSLVGILSLNWRFERLSKELGFVSISSFGDLYV